MRQLIRIFLTINILCFTVVSSFATLHGTLEYTIPVDYSQINLEETDTKANLYYDLAMKNKSGNLDENITYALNLYSILCNKSPDNIFYAIRLGTLYDLIGKDRYAKGNYYRALSIDESRPEPYFYFGEFYYKRAMFKKALKMYTKAYNNGYIKHYETLYKLGDIYQKFGDTQQAQKYFKSAANIQSNVELDKKIETVNTTDCSNKVYYKR